VIVLLSAFFLDFVTDIWKLPFFLATIID